MIQLSFAGIDVEQLSPVKARKAMRKATATAKAKVESSPRVAKRKKPLRKAPPMTPAQQTEQWERLSRQEKAIVERLRVGTATNVELAEIALKYTSRISNIRKAGYVVELVSRGEHGLTTYQLREQ